MREWRIGTVKSVVVNMINTNAIWKGYAPVMIVLVVAVWVLAILSLEFALVQVVGESV